MKTKKRKKIIIAIAVPVSVVALYFLLCLALYLFEPAYFEGQPDLYDYPYCFNLYSQFSKDNDDSFYIRQITADDVAPTSDKRLKYVDGTADIVVPGDADYNDIASLASDCGGEICGYIEKAGFYQIYFSDTDYNSLLEKCEELESYETVTIAIPDYFEDTAEETAFAQDSVTNPYSNEEEATDEHGQSIIVDKYYDTMIGADSFRKQFGDFSDVKIGMIDSPADGKSKYITVARTDYSDDFKYEHSHDNCVGSILAASYDSQCAGICPDAQIYSYNGLNCSLAYFVASITDMVVNEGIQAINISMCYNEFVNISASLGCESAQEYIEDGNKLFSSFLSNIIDNGHEFVICLAAGNESRSYIYKVNSPLFDYGDKKILSSVDFCHIFATKVRECDANYSYFISNPPNEEVAARIIVVGACDYLSMTNFSNAGDAIDIAAPGSSIFCLADSDEYIFADGTSMAAPFVTGTAAALFYKYPDLTGSEVKEIIVSSSTSSAQSCYNDKVYPVLNSANALEYADAHYGENS